MNQQSERAVELLKKYSRLLRNTGYGERDGELDAIDECVAWLSSQPLTPILEHATCERCGSWKVKLAGTQVWFHPVCNPITPATSVDVSGWQSIASAPKDGRHILVATVGGDAACKASWNGECWLESSHEEPRRVLFPTTWQPLPLPSSGECE